MFFGVWSYLEEEEEKDWEREREREGGREGGTVRGWKPEK